MKINIKGVIEAAVKEQLGAENLEYILAKDRSLEKTVKQAMDDFVKSKEAKKMIEDAVKRYIKDSLDDYNWLDGISNDVYKLIRDTVKNKAKISFK